MIEYIRGTIAELSPTLAVLDANGVGYGMSITLNTYSAIQGLQGDVKLYVYESIREDAYQLWGFATKVERELFLQLLTVSGEISGYGKSGSGFSQDEGGSSNAPQSRSIWDND